MNSTHMLSALPASNWTGGVEELIRG